MSEFCSRAARARGASVSVVVGSVAAAAVEPLEARRLYSVAPWTTLGKLPVGRGSGSDLQLASFRPYTLQSSAITDVLKTASAENVAKYGVGRGAKSVLVSVPRPDGSLQRFRVVESDILTGNTEKRYGNLIKTYVGYGVDDKSASIRLDTTPLGFHAQVLTGNAVGSYAVDPYYKSSTGVYASYYVHDATVKGTVAAKDDVIAAAGGKALAAAAAGVGGLTAARTSGTQLRTYRTAVATTGEFSQYYATLNGLSSPTVANTLAAVVTIMNRVDGVYETELSIRLSLVSNESSLIYTNAGTDPYSNSNSSALLNQNQTTIDNVIGSGNYDIGHVFSTAGGGLADLGVVGQDGYKAMGETGTDTPVGDGFSIDYVAHEMGHQFGANHTFNTSQDGNRNAATAVEPGSGSTIMAYAGIEGNEDLQPHSDPYFSFISLNEILNYVDTSIPSVGTRTSTGNAIPTVTTGTMAYTIPANTPFTLTSPTATDANGDTVYYSWEEADTGSSALLSGGDNGSNALFRDYNPTTSPSRTFPQLSSVLAGQTYTATANGSTYHAEQLPTTSRAMKFVLTLRDEKAGGGGTNVLSGTGAGTTAATITPTATVTSVSGASGFAVTDLNSATTLTGGSSQTITWNVAGTTGNGINTATVNILMSTDGGQTFATTLAAATPNDGAETVKLPYGVGSSQVRFKVAAVGNIYFDINNANLTLTNVAAPAPSTVSGVTIDDGTVQRSRVRTATVTFNGTIPAANFAAGAFTLTQTSGTIGSYTATIGSVTNPTAGTTVVQLIFGGAATVGGSVADGRYDLVIDGSKITDSNGQKVDAAGTGTAGSARTTSFFRLATDATGDGKVTIADFNVLAAAFNTRTGQTGYVDAMDVNGDGAITISDFNELASRFNTSV